MSAKKTLQEVMTERAIDCFAEQELTGKRCGKDRCREIGERTFVEQFYLAPGEPLRGWFYMRDNGR